MTLPPEPVLALVGLSAGYATGPVVHDIDLTLHAGEVVALVGANGAGKSTTLLACSGLARRFGGTLTVLGRSVTTRTRPDALARSGLAHVPEDRALFPSLTTHEHIRLGLRREDRGRARGRTVESEVLDLFPALVPIAGHAAGLLSGGEQQMLALARALAGRPRLLLVDELSLGLAPVIVERLLPTLRSVADDAGVGILLVEQHVPLALAVADRATVLRRGRVVASGTATALAADRGLLEASYLGTATPGPAR